MAPLKNNPPKLLLLGGLSYLLPVIREAHKIGAFVITADNIPDNIAHRYSDRYINVSVIDKDEVLKAAKELQIDGIMSFAVDPGVTSAAYVAEKLGLPFQCSYKSACILQNKVLFRQFLVDNAFNCPKAKGYTDVEEAVSDTDFFTFPVIVKPADSAGSKGVSKVCSEDCFESAAEKAMSLSHCRQIIVEEYLESSGRPSGYEAFVRDGKLFFCGSYDQYFDASSENPFTPSAEVCPSMMSGECLEEVNCELERLFSLLGVRTGLFNIEFRKCTDGKLYLMEVSPRAGGNRLSEMLIHAAGVNLIEAETRNSLGMDIARFNISEFSGHYTVFILHSNTEGLFDGIEISPQFSQRHLVEKDVIIKKGDAVRPFSGANSSIGTLVLKFDSREELDEAIEHHNQWLTVNIK